MGLKGWAGSRPSSSLRRSRHDRAFVRASEQISGFETMSNGNSKIRVLVVDDSVLMSRQISGILNDDETIEVVGRAKDGQEALAMVEELKPDVVTMDVEMPRMNGITALKHIMVRYSVPTVMISALTTEGARTTFDALKYGAIDVIAKPSRREDVSLDAQKADIISKVKRAASIRTGRSKYIRMVHAQAAGAKTDHGPADAMTRIIGIGTGTGGYYGLLRIVPALPSGFSDILVALIQVASRYVEPFIAYLESQSAIPVKGVHNGDRAKRGVCYVGSSQDGVVLADDESGGISFKLGGAAAGSGGGLVDGFFRSMSAFGDRSVGVIMTGSGKDGAQGLLEIKNAGGLCIAQDINNCLDPQMPLSALEKDAVQRILPDYKMADFFLKLTA